MFDINHDGKARLLRDRNRTGNWFVRHGMLIFSSSAG